nr:colanic acid biosynthesis glycosyltransferase WcaL [Chthoniobacterales bacterium]
VEHGTSGILVPERDADALARELLRLMNEQVQLTALARNGAEAVAEKFEQSAQVRRLESHYLETVRRT